MDLDVRLLRSFLAVAEDRNFSRAARRLNLAQQSLSSQIQQLERRLGLRLFERDTRRVELTDAGRLLLDKASLAVQATDDVVAEARHLLDGQPRRLTVLYSSSASFDTAPAVVHALHAARSGLVIEATHATTPDLLRRVADGEADLGIARHPPPVTGLRFDHLRRDPPVLLAPADHPLAGRSTVTLDDLADHPVALHARHANPVRYDRHVQVLRAAGVTIVEPLQLSFTPNLRDIRQGHLGITGASITTGGLPDGVRAVPITGVASLADDFYLVSRHTARNPSRDDLRDAARERVRHWAVRHAWTHGSP